MNELRRTTLFIGGMLLIVFLLESCSTSQRVIGGAATSTSLVPATATYTHTPTFTQKASPTQSSTATSTPTFTRTSTPTLTSTSTATYTITAIPTWTPLPTLSTEKAKEFAIELYKTNRGCLLPCWWGIVPGQTTWQEANQFLAQFAEISAQVSPVDDNLLIAFALISVPEEIFHIPLQQIYQVQNGVVTSIEIGIRNIPEYTLSSFLNTYGQPGEVWLSTYGTNPDQWGIPLFSVLFYPDQGILAAYLASEVDIVGDQVRGCDMDGTVSTLALWSPTQEMTFMEAARKYRIKSGDMLFLPIEKSTQMDVKTFYETYIIPNNPTCIETPAELWPRL